MITSSYNHLYFTFVTDGSMNNRGFVMNYTTVEVELTTTALPALPCPGVRRGGRGAAGAGRGDPEPRPPPELPARHHLQVLAAYDAGLALTQIPMLNT